MNTESSYSPKGVARSLPSPASSSQVSPDTGRRRRPPSQSEESRRKAWGVQWGEIMHQYAVEKGWKANR